MLNNNNTTRGTCFGCENERMDQGRSFYQKNIYISHCFFSRSIVYTGNGGIIYVDSGAYSMDVIYSMFFNCASSSKGGAIYFRSSNSSLRMICADCCYGGDYEKTYLFLIWLHLS